MLRQIISWLTYLLTYLLTHSMVHSPSWEANWFAASQEIPRISLNPKVHYRTHKRPPPVSILGQPNPVHIPTSHLLEIHPNMIHPSTPRSHQWSLSLQFPNQDPIHPPLLTHTRHIPSPSHSSRFYHPHDIGWEVNGKLIETGVQTSGLLKYSTLELMWVSWKRKRNFSIQPKIWTPVLPSKDYYQPLFLVLQCW